MESLWPEDFSQEEMMSAKRLISNQASILRKITDGYAEGRVTAVDTVTAMRMGVEFSSSNFIFKFELIGRFLENYKYLVFYFWHEIDIYPVNFRLGGDLASELGILPSGAHYDVIISSPANLENFLGAVLKSKKIRTVVGSIISLSKS